MKKIYTWLPFLLFTILLFTGCYSKRPIATGFSNPDYNQRVEVSDAGYVKRKNALGITLNIGIVGAGAYGGYALAPFHWQDGAEQKPIHALNIATGAIASAGLVLITDLIMGNNSHSTIIKEPQNWIKRVNKDYKFLSGSNSHFTMINPAVESRFQVKDIEDVKDFKKGFENSNHTETIISDAVKNLKRNELPDLISLYPQSKNIDNAKMRYINESGTVNELVSADKQYPEVKLDIESIAFNMTLKSQNINEYESFFIFFPESDKNTEIFQTGLKLIPDKKEYSKFIAKAPAKVNDKVLNGAKWEYIRSFKNIDDVAIAYQLYPTSVDKAAVINELKNNDQIKTIADLKKLKEKFGYVSGATESLIEKVKPSIPISSYYEIPQIYPEIDETTKKLIMVAYRSEELNAYEKALKSNDLSLLKSFIDLYKNKPYDKELMTQAEFTYEYNYLRQNAASISRYATFARNYPQYFNEMDDLAYGNVAITNKSSIDEYVRYFSKGKYVDVVKGKIPEVQAYEQKKEYERKTERCHTCHGNGNCPTCNGRGESKCTLCNGAGYTTGWGDEVKSCYCGNGYRKCSSCDGRGRCYHCKGSGLQNR